MGDAWGFNVRELLQFIANGGHNYGFTIDVERTNNSTQSGLIEIELVIDAGRYFLFLFIRTTVQVTILGTFEVFLLQVLATNECRKIHNDLKSNICCFLVHCFWRIYAL